jgi:hypothetical protein
MGHHPGITAERDLPAATQLPAGGRGALLAILTDPAVLRIALFAAGIATLLLVVAAAL